MAQEDFSFPIATAAINWFDSSDQLHVHVYSSDGNYVTERIKDGEGWTSTDFKKPESHVSATCWTDRDGVHIRVYCTGQNRTAEWCQDPGTGWHQGDYTPS